MKPVDFARRPEPQLAYRPLQATFLAICHNNAAQVAEALESIWQEACATAGEIVLIDDGSTDGSDRLCAEFAASHARVRFWRQPHCGLFRTLNMFGGTARGDWVRLCAGDTVLLPGSTRRLIAAAEQTGAGVACGGVALREADAAPSRRRGKIDPEAEVPHLHANGLSYVARRLSFPLSSVVYRQDHLERALPLPADLIACPNLAILFSALSRTALASVQHPVCIAPDPRPHRLATGPTLELQQTIRIVQRYAACLHGNQKRAGLFNAANRTRARLRHMPERNALGVRLWLHGIALFGRLGLLDFGESMDRLARLCEAELGAALTPAPNAAAMTDGSEQSAFTHAISPVSLVADEDRVAA